MSPMSASSPFIDVRLLDHPVRYDEIDPFPEAAGAECVFLGRTRVEVHPAHGRLMRLSYEAYVPMAESLLRSLANAAAARWPLSLVRLHHALGEVAPGEASVLVHVIAPHRAESFDACRFLIDELKRAAPIWKREVWEDGTSWSTGQTARAPAIVDRLETP
jgi:molybdopterin synthase catalytic subunit